MTGRVLVLGGTGEARRLATVLADEGVDVVSSLAGRVADPVLPPGEVRVGGFGGVAGLVAWLQEHPVAAVVDATHPFAATMTASAAEAAGLVGVPLLRVQRPGWTPQAGGAGRPGGGGGPRWPRAPRRSRASGTSSSPRDGWGWVPSPD